MAAGYTHLSRQPGVATAAHLQVPLAATLAAYQAAVAAAATLAPPHRAQRPAVPPGYPIGDYEHHELVELVEMVRWVRSDTLLRTEDEVVAEVMKALGFKPRGPRVVAAILAAVRDSASNVNLPSSGRP